MGRYNNKGNGHFYPMYEPKESLRIIYEDTLDVILYCLDKKIKEVRLRLLMNDIFEYLETFEGFYYGISEEAYKLINNNVVSSDIVTLDHGVPLKVLIQELKSIKPKDREELLNFFKKHFFLCFITKDEDKKLNKYKLKQKMPIGWEGDGKNWKIRYESVGITLKVDPGYHFFRSSISQF